MWPEYAAIESPDETAAHVAKILQNGSDAFETRHRRKDGNTRDVLVSARVIRYEGRPLFLTIFQDITERKTVETELLHNRDRLVQAQAMAHLGHWEWDVINDHISWSEELYRIFGVSPETFTPTFGGFLLLLHPDDREQVTKAVRQTLESPAFPYDIQCRIPLPQDERVVHARGEVRRDPSGKPLFMVGMIQDVTERSRMEVALRRSNEELERFAFVASHDLQEPLRKINSFGRLLKKEYENVITGDGLYYIERMGDSAYRMQKLIDDLLAYSRVATRAQTFSDCNLNRILREVLENLSDRIMTSQAEVNVGPLPGLEADAVQMGQLLQNLIGNALKFQQADQRPQVEVAGRLLESGYCELTVRDNGIGFDESQLGLILQPFQRLHGRSEYEGSGIGLAICDKIIRRHMGTLTVRSAEGKGTTFIVTLPLRQYQKGGAYAPR